MTTWQKLLARAGQLLLLLLAHQMPSAQLPGPGLTTPEPNKSHPGIAPIDYASRSSAELAPSSSVTAD